MHTDENQVRPPHPLGEVRTHETTFAIRVHPCASVVELPLLSSGETHGDDFQCPFAAGNFQADALPGAAIEERAGNG